jgi:flagellar P-ring protein FlgI
MRGLSTAVAAALLFSALPLSAQEVRVRELTLVDATVPVRLMGYGLVVGLDGSGDRPQGGRSGGQTVQSVSNLLRRFDIEVPPEVLRTRNVAAVLVTAEVSPYLRPGGRFELQVSSLGDARSLRGGVLWMTPLVADVGGPAVATAQGPLLLTDNGATRGTQVETSARLPSGGVLERDLPRPAFASASRLLLREPDLGNASRIVAAINAAVGAGTARVEDPGSIALTPPQGQELSEVLTRIQDLRIQPDRIARLVIDARDGTVVAGAELVVGEAMVSHAGITLSIGGGPAGAGEGEVRLAAGTSVQEVAGALHAMRAAPAEVAAIFESLRAIGALAAEVVIR